MDLGLEVVTHVLATVIVAERQTVGEALGAGTEALAHRLPERLHSLEAIGVAAGMDANTFDRAVIDGDEHRSLALAGLLFIRSSVNPHARPAADLG